MGHVLRTPLSHKPDFPDLPSPEEILGRAAGENFPVATRWLPAATRRHLMAAYGYARLTDYLGDEYRGDRLSALDWLQREVEYAMAGEEAAHPLVGAAARSVRQLGIDPRPLFDLIEANRWDQVKQSYATFDDLVDYCRLSANPIGRLVLGVFGMNNPEREAWSDWICTGLQLAEHWQDVVEDAAGGRVYIPQDDLERFGVEPAALRAPPAGAPLRGLMAFQVARSRLVLARGEPLIGDLSGRPRVAVAAFAAGGRAALDAVADQNFDPFAGAAHRSAPRAALHLVKLLATRRVTRSATCEAHP